MLSLRWNKKHSSWLLMTKFHWLLVFVDVRERSKKFKSQTAHYWKFQPPFKPHNHKMSFIYLSLSIFRTEILDNATSLFNDIQNCVSVFQPKKNTRKKQKSNKITVYVYKIRNVVSNYLLVFLLYIWLLLLFTLFSFLIFL